MRILFVCSGNTCRSPLAAALARDALAFAGGEHVVESAGLHARSGGPASPGARAVAQERGLSLSRHRARRVDAALVAGADATLCMESAHVDACSALAPGARVERLAEEDLADPIGSDVEAYRVTAQALQNHVDAFLAAQGLLRYQPYWCEENVWQLLGEARLEGRDAHAVVVSNPTGSVAMWGQRAALVPGTPVVWDYHVLVIVRGDDEWEAWDHDHTGGRRTRLATWLAASFGHVEQLPDEFHPRFRVVDASTWRSELSSDRHHMRDERGAFVKAPPPWPPVGSGPHNLDRFIDMERAFVGEVMGLAGLRARFLGGET